MQLACKCSIEFNRGIRFTFNNILLPDSNVDEQNSHGTIIYSISQNQLLPTIRW